MHVNIVHDSGSVKHAVATHQQCMASGIQQVCDDNKLHIIRVDNHGFIVGDDQEVGMALK